MSTRIDPTAPNQGPGDSSAEEGSIEQQNYHHFYNQYYNHQNPSQHHQTGRPEYQHHDVRLSNYNEYHSNSQQQPYQHQWGPPHPYYNNQGYPPQSHQQQQFRNPHQFYPAEQQQEQAPLPNAERPPPAPLDSLQMLVKENGAVNGGGGDKRPRHSDEAAGDSEGRKRRRKSDRPTRISNEAAVKTDEPLPAAEPPPTAAEPAEKPATSSTEEEVAVASNDSTTEPEAQNAASLPTEEGESANGIAKKEEPTSPAEDAAVPSTPVTSPKKKGRPKGSKNVKKREPKLKLVFDNSDDDKKKKKKKGGKKKLLGKAVAGSSKPAEPVAVAEEKEKLVKGPFVKIAGDRETVINSSKAEDEINKKPKSCFIDAELRTKVAGLGFSSAMAQHYDAFTTDETWVCAFCKRGSHHNALGDLFGPYFVQTAKKKKKFEVWVHEECCVWAPGVGLVGQRLIGLQEAIFTSAEEVCEICEKKGAMIGCVKRDCNRKVHYPCTELWHMDEENFVSCCPDHKRKSRK